MKDVSIHLPHNYSLLQSHLTDGEKLSLPIELIPKWNMSQILVDQMAFRSVPLRVHGKVVILQCRFAVQRRQCKTVNVDVFDSDDKT